MPSFNVEVSHGLGQELATQRLQEFMEQVRHRYQDQLSDMQGQWSGNRLSFAFKTFGFAIRGTLNVGPQSAQVNGELPLAAMLFKGRVEQSIRAELSKVLD